MSVILSDVSKSFRDKQVLSHINASFDSPGIYLILGENGCGKTTLFRSITGLLKSYTGSISMTDSCFGSPGETAFLNHLSGYENLRYFVPDFSKKNYASLCETFEMNSYIHKEVKSYSAGMRRRLAIVMTLLSDATIMLFDEPLCGLDFRASRELGELLLAERKRGKNILLTSHQFVPWFRKLDGVYVFQNGTLLPRADLLPAGDTYRLHFACDDDVKKASVLLRTRFSPVTESEDGLSVGGVTIVNDLINVLKDIPVMQLEKEEYFFAL